jgi:hypothetical protein
MIPEKIIRFLQERASIGFAGTRDANLVPRGHRVAGWLVGIGGRTLTALIPDSSVPHLVEALQDNGCVAVTFEEPGTHETYQLKGRYLSHRPVQPAEMDVASRIRERFVKGLATLLPYPGVADLLGPSVGAPRLAVEIEVHEVFLQTPGPGAGTRLVPAPDAEASAT